MAHIALWRHGFPLVFVPLLFGVDTSAPVVINSLDKFINS